MAVDGSIGGARTESVAACPAFAGKVLPEIAEGTDKVLIDNCEYMV
jgi:hypothetical protein